MVSQYTGAVVENVLHIGLNFVDASLYLLSVKSVLKSSMSADSPFNDKDSGLKYTRLWHVQE
jgi:hypothetical protein